MLTPIPLSSQKSILLFHKADWNKFSETIDLEIHEIPSVQLSAETIGAAAERISTLITKAAKLAIPSVTVKRKTITLPPHILELIKQKRKIYILFHRTGPLNTAWNRLW